MIISLENFKATRLALAIRPGNAEVAYRNLVATSGGFDPIHPGHTSCLIESKKYASELVVIVNGDWFLRNKKGKSFQNLDTRCQIVDAIEGVDYVIPYEVEGDTTVCEALRVIQPDVFTKGGDRVKGSVPEVKVCEELGIPIKYNVGLAKDWSSSDSLQEWCEWYTKEVCTWRK